VSPAGAPDRFALALQHHQAGRLADAAALYQGILAQDPQQADCLHLLGVIANQLGQPADAAESIGRAIAIKPGEAAYHTNLGEALRRLGRLDEAVASFRRALALQPDLAAAHGNLGVALQAQGELDAAASSFRQAIALAPDYVEAHNNLGSLLLARGELAAARAAYERALAVRPHDPLLLDNLGMALLALGRGDEAASCFERALALAPDLAAAHGHLGDALQRHGALDAALASYDRALALQPDDASLHAHRGAALWAQGEVGPAIAAFRRALARAPNHADAHNNLANALQSIGQLDAALEHYRRALAQRPDDPDAAANLAGALALQGDTEAALEQYERALARRPGDPEILNGRATALLRQGQLAAARADYETAFAAAPERSEIHSNLLFLLNYDPAVSDAALLAAHRGFGARLAATAAPAPPHANPREPARRLKVGYVSADFGRHPVGYFILPVLAAHDAAAVETYCYSGRVVEDDQTARIRAAAHAWRSTIARSDAVLAAQIRADGIDILVDLAGHTAGNRLTLFAGRPAPLQVTWLGYPATTGLAAIDYRLTDAIADPAPTADRQSVERLVRLPDGFHCYAPPESAPEVGPLPARAAGTITFASFNNPAKLNDAVFACWRRVLDGTPDSRLLIKAWPLASAPTRRLYLDRLAGAGIAPARVGLLAPSRGWSEHMAHYGDVDIALDSFPYNGTTTTCDALWMGVPVIALAGGRHAARVGASLLAHAGLTDLVGRDTDDYVAKATALAHDFDRLAALRAGLRDRVRRSPLGDPQRFTSSLEAAYRSMWRDWCAAPARGSP